MAGDKDVRGFYVAMRDALLVGRIHPFECLKRNIEHALKLNCALRFVTITNRPRCSNQFAQSLALKQFHHNERLTGMFFDAMNGANIGMVEGGSRSRFAFEAILCRRIMGQFFRQEFERNAST